MEFSGVLNFKCSHTREPLKCSTHYVNWSVTVMVCVFSCSQHTHIPRGLSDRSLAGDYVGSETVWQSVALCVRPHASVYVCSFCHVFFCICGSTVGGFKWAAARDFSAQTESAVMRMSCGNLPVPALMSNSCTFIQHYYSSMFEEGFLYTPHVWCVFLSIVLD